MAGVCGGLARTLRVDPALIRVAALFATAIGGVGLVAYSVATVVLEEPEADDPVALRRGRVSMLLAITLLVIAIVIGLAISDTLIDPGGLISAALLIGGVGLVWRRSGGAGPLSTGDDGGRVVRIITGLGLVLGGVILYGGTGTDLSRAGSAAIAAGIVAAGAGLIFAPRLAATREALDEARRERIRAEEQEALAARLHDSVLQTLALIQRESEEGGRAAALARRQERELRDVLYGHRRPDEATLSAAMRDVAGRIEEQHGIRVDLVQTRDLPLTDATEALAAAAGEALTNAAKHAGVDTVSAMVRVDDQRATVFIRDRGAGFDPAAPSEGQGISGSIEGRLGRVGGSATIDSAPGSGTEVELSVPIPVERGA